MLSGIMSSVAGTAWKAVKPHMPLIKFRKGGLVELVRGTPNAAAAAGTPLAQTTAPTTEKPPEVLEEWNIPHKYRRLRISEEEIEFINRGGPA